MEPSGSNGGHPDDLTFLNTDLQRSIMAASLQAKTLFCLVTDGSETSQQWETTISDQKYRAGLLSKAITLKIHAGTQEATYLNTVCPLNGLPAIVSIKRGSIEENLQHPHVTLTELRAKLDSSFAAENAEEDRSLYEDPSHGALELIHWFHWIRRLPHFRWIAQYANYVFIYRNDRNASVSTDTVLDDPATNPYLYIVLPTSAGRMRLPNNAYDALGVQTQKWLDQDIRGDNVLRLQLKLLRNIPALESAVTEIENRDQSVAPELSSQHQDRLLNTPSAALRINQPATSPAPTARSPSPPSQTSTSVETSQNTARDASQTRAHEQLQQDRLRLQEQRRSDQQQQRTNYVQAQREREAAERAERERIKARIASDRAQQRHLDEVRRQDGRKAELQALRQANSTTANPQSSDIRVQVRTFDGSTIRTTFTHDSSITSHVRPWIDQTSKQPTPYNLKLILTPLPNRNIEAGEEEQSLSDLGIIGSATMVMVPVKGYVESYAGGSTGLVSAVTGAVGGVLSGLGGLIGWGGGNPTDSPVIPQAADQVVTSPAEPRVRVRTLADQRAEEAKKQGNELYNGNQLNFQGRKDDDADKKQD